MARAKLGSKTNQPLYERELVSTLLEFTAEYKVERILKLIVEKIPKLVQASEASLFWLDRESNRVELKETSGKNKKNIGTRWYAIGEGLTGWVAKTGRPLRVKNIEDEIELKRIDPNLHWVDKYKGFANASTTEKLCQRAFLAVPIRIEGITMGVLRFAKTEKPGMEFSQEHEEFAVDIAKHLSAIIKKAELLQKAEDFDGLIDEPVFFKSRETMDAYFRWAANLLPTILNSNGCTIFLKDEDQGSYVLRYTSKDNPLKDEVGIASYDKGEGLTGWVLLTGEPLRVNDIENEDELKSINPSLKWKGKHKEFLVHHSNFLAAPIKTARNIYGVIRLSKEADSIPFSKHDERLLCNYGRFLGQALRTLELEEDGTMVVKPRWRVRASSGRHCCYVLMPFSTEWSNNIRRAIKVAVESHNLQFRIADQEIGRSVMEDIWKGICGARLVIADLSTANPNVAYEVGLCDVLGKEVILLAQDPKAIPFDFAGARLLVYSLNRIDELQDKLAERIAQTLHQSSDMHLTSHST